MQKKIFRGIFGLLFVTLLAGCGKSNTGPDAEQSREPLRPTQVEQFDMTPTPVPTEEIKTGEATPGITPGGEPTGEATPGITPGGEPTGEATPGITPEEEPMGEATPTITMAPVPELPGAADAQEKQYENTFFGIGCRLPADWELAAVDELAAESGITLLQYQDIDYLTTKVHGGFYAMLAGTETTSLGIKIHNTVLDYGLPVGEENFIRYFSERNAIDAKEMGIELRESREAAIRIAGSDHRSLYTALVYQETALHTLQIAIEHDGYLLEICITGQEYETVFDAVHYFYLSW